MKPYITIALILLIAVGGCAMATTSRHAFSFNAMQESPGIEVMDWSYGDSNNYGARPQPDRAPAQIINIMGEIKKPNSLYVQWRDKKTGKIYEDTVKLMPLLPADITDDRIHFTIKDNELHVYLITNKPRPDGWPIYASLYSKIYQTYEIYPKKSP